MQTQSSVLIVGAGPTGLTLGCQLRLAGIRCRLVERAVSRNTESRALGVHARSLEVLEQLGIVERMLAAGTPTEYLTLHVGGRPLVRLPYGELDAPHACMLVIPQYETERILEERFRELGGTVERGVTLTKLELRESGAFVTLASDTGEQHTWFPYVVGCDGAHSAVRAAIDVPFEGAKYEDTFVLGDIRLGRAVPRNEAVAFASTRGIAVVLPLPGGRSRIIGPAGDNLPPGPAGVLPFEVFDRVVRALDVLGDAPITDPQWVARFNVHRRIARTFRVGPVFLAGDAAHIHSPAGGQGMNLGIQDAFNLGWKLAMVVDGAASPSLLDSYEVERRPIALTTVNATDSVTKLATVRNPVAIVLRNLLVPFILRRILGRRMLMGASQLGTSYAPDGLAFGAAPKPGLASLIARLVGALLVLFGVRSRALASGVRAPDALLDPVSKARLFTAFDAKAYTLLVFAGSRDPDAVMADARRMARPYASHVHTHIVTRMPSRASQFCSRADLRASTGSELLDRTGAAHRRYGALGGRVVLVRPDGYIACSADLTMLDQIEKQLAHLLPGLQRQRPRSPIFGALEHASSSSTREERT